MTLIPATVQRPAPKPDRELARRLPEPDIQNPPDRGQDGTFAAVLRKIADAPSTSSADDGRDDAATPSDAAAPGRPDAARTAPAQPAADLAGAGATALASVLNTALPAAGAPAASNPAGASAGPSTGDPPAPRPTAPDAAIRPGSAPVRAAGSAQGPLAGSGSGPMQASPMPVSPIPAVTVLDRAVHFKPVLPPSERPDAVPAEAATATPGAAVIAGQHAARTGLTDIIATAAQNRQVPIPVEPQAPDDAAMRAAPGEADKAEPSVLEDGRAIPGIARTVLTTGGHPGRPDGAALARGDGVGTEAGLAALALPSIAAAIADEIARATTSGPDPVGNRADPAVAPPPDGPLRVLRIQLKPEELGTVTVELRLANGQLETHLRASRPETATLLHRDAAVLTDLLKQANAQATVTVGPARPAEAGGSAGGAPSQGQPSFTDGGARPGTGENRHRQAAHRPAAGRHDGERMDETVRPRDGGVYL